MNANIHFSNRALVQRWTALLAENPRLRIRDAAEQLGVSELELRATELRDGDPTDPGVRRLHPDRMQDLLGDLHELGEIMALTRNDWAVHEKVGEWETLEINGGHGLVLGDPIDLRLFLDRWTHALAVTETIAHGPGAGGLRHSFHFFDASGVAIHKVYVRDPQATDVFVTLVTRYRATEQLPPAVVAAPARDQPRPDDEIDVTAFQAAWLGMQDTHEFFGILRRFGLGRTQALRLAPNLYARQVGLDSLARVLEQAATTEVPIMIFVGNHGCIQIHTGPVKKIVTLGTWLNVMDPGFNLHLRADAIAACWVVRKPTADGDVTSLELYDAQGDNIAMLFGARKSGTPELTEWRELLANLGSDR